MFGRKVFPCVYFLMLTDLQCYNSTKFYKKPPKIEYIARSCHLLKHSLNIFELLPPGARLGHNQVFYNPSQYVVPSFVCHNLVLFCNTSIRFILYTVVQIVKLLANYKILLYYHRTKPRVTPTLTRSVS